MKLQYFAIVDRNSLDSIQLDLGESSVLPVELFANEITEQQHRFLMKTTSPLAEPYLMKLSIDLPYFTEKMRDILEEKILAIIPYCSEEILELNRVEQENVNQLNIELNRYPVHKNPDSYLDDAELFLSEIDLGLDPSQLENTIDDSELNKLNFEILDKTPRFRGTFESLSLNTQTELRRTVRNGKLESVNEKFLADAHNLANHFFSRSDMIEILNETYSRCKPALSEEYITERVNAIINTYEEAISWFHDNVDKRSWEDIEKLKRAKSVLPVDAESMDEIKASMMRNASANGDLTRLARKLYPREETQEAIAMTRADINKGEVLLPVSKESIAIALIDVLQPQKSIGKDSNGVEREELFIYDRAEGVRVRNPYDLVMKIVNHFSIGENGLKLKDTKSIYLQLLTAAEEIDLITEIEKTRSKYFAMQNCLVDFRTLTPVPFSPEHFILTKHPSPFIADFDNLAVPKYTLENGVTIYADRLLKEYSLNSDGTESREDELLLIQLLKMAMFPQLFAHRPNAFLKGVTGGGKSAYIAILNAILGGFAAPTTLTSLDEQNFPLEHTIGAAAVVEEEMPKEGFSGGVKMLKSMTSGGNVEVKRKGLPSLIVGYQNTAIFLATNHPIIFRDMDEIGKIMRRFTFAAFEHVIENQDENVHTWLQNDRDFQTWFTNYILQVKVPTERIVTERSERLIAETIKGDPFNDFALQQLEAGEPVVFSMFLKYAVQECSNNTEFLDYNDFLNKVKATLVMIKQQFGKGVELKTQLKPKERDFEYLEEISKDFALLTPTQRKNFSKQIGSSGNKKITKAFPNLAKSIDEVTFQAATIGEIENDSRPRFTKLVHK